GVRGMKVKDGDDAVVGAAVAQDGEVMLFVSSSGHGKRTRLDAFNRQGRGGQGVRGMKITASRGAVVAAFTVSPTDEILVFSSGGNIIRMEAKEISAQGRDATGERVARLEPGEAVSAGAPVLEAEAAAGEDPGDRWGAWPTTSGRRRPSARHRATPRGPRRPPPVRSTGRTARTGRRPPLRRRRRARHPRPEQCRS